MRRSAEATHRLTAAVIGHVENPRQELGLPLNIRGTIFQQRIGDP